MVPMYAKAMDTVVEEMEEEDNLGIKIEEQNIPALVFMDDLTSLAEGYQQEEKTLESIHNFGIRHKIEWGENKCKVMEVGSHKEKKKEWKLGDKIIENCKTYKYLGEIISRDGKNTENLLARQGKVTGTVRAINMRERKNNEEDRSPGPYDSA